MRVTSFCSGSNNAPVIRGVSRAGYDVGTSAAELGPSGLDGIIFHLSTGGKVFVDSGAFSAFRQGRPITDWNAVFAVYHQVVDVNRGGEVHVVAPDVIGDQAATLALWLEHREELENLGRRGARVIFPLQCGELSLSALWSLTPPIPGKRAGIPSNACAVPTHVLLDFVAGSRPDSLHLLGISLANSRAANLFASIESAHPEIELSCDANRVAAQLGRGRPITSLLADEEFANQIGDELSHAMSMEMLDDPHIFQLAAAQFGHLANPEDDDFLASIPGPLLDTWLVSEFGNLRASVREEAVRIALDPEEVTLGQPSMVL